VADLPDNIRAFVAIRVDADVQRAIADLIMELSAQRNGIKWVSTANLHLTLKFLGPAVPLGNLERLIPELEKIAADTKPFGLEASGVGGFPDLKHPQVLWVGFRSDVLSDLASGVEEAASRCGFAREPRAFNAHLTIGRLKNPRLRSETRARIDAAMNRDFGASTIREMTLYRSITAVAGPIYQGLRDFKFNG
jgi:2'-5' RNA ligase